MIDKDFCDRMKRGAETALGNIKDQQGRLALQEQFWQGYIACIGEFARAVEEEEDERSCGCGATGDHDESHERID